VTAINVLITHREAHLFADTGHYDESTKGLNHLAPKVFPLPNKGCLLAWSGPSFLGPVLAEMCARCIDNLFEALPSLAMQLGVLQGFSAILVAPGKGVAVEEGGVVHRLTPGSVVKTISTLSQLDPEDLRGSGIRLMEAQRQSSGVVFGQCQYYRLSETECTMEVLYDWSDKPAPLIKVDTLAAKIQNLAVDVINVAANAVTKVIQNTTMSSGMQVSTSNPGNFPNLLWAQMTCKYTGGGTSAWADIDADIRRVGDNTLIDAVSFHWDGGSTGTITVLDMFGMDVGMSANPAYKLSWLINTSGGGGAGASVTIQSGILKAFHSVK